MGAKQAPAAHPQLLGGVGSGFGTAQTLWVFIVVIPP